MHRCNRHFISFVWGAVHIIEMLWKIQNVYNMTILHVYRRRLVMDCLDPSLPKTVPIRQQSGFAERNLSRLDVIWMKRSSSGYSCFWSVRVRAVSSIPCLPETIVCSVSSSFIKTKMTSSIINDNTSFSHANYSDAFVSGRLPRFHIPKFHNISVTYDVFTCKDGYANRRTLMEEKKWRAVGSNQQPLDSKSNALFTELPR